MFNWFKEAALKVPLRKHIDIRLEAIGGQGANSAGKILAEIGILEHHYTGNHFSSFGSEKRGTPVKSYVRLSTERKPIRSASAIRSPDLLVVFHPFLLESHPEILDGSGPETDVLINTPESPAQLKWPEGFRARFVGTVNATQISHHVGCGFNAVLLGAMIRLIPEFKQDATEQVVERFFSKLSKEERQKNLKGFRSGLEKVEFSTFVERKLKLKTSTMTRIHYGYDDAPLGGIITQPANMALKNHASSRKGFAPRLNLEACCHCGFCDQVCPDFCFKFELDPTQSGGARLLGIDYQYCKGCQKCIQSCPVDALTLSPENEILDSEKKHFWLEKKV